MLAPCPCSRPNAAHTLPTLAARPRSLLLLPAIPPPLHTRLRPPPCCSWGRNGRQGGRVSARHTWRLAMEVGVLRAFVADTGFEGGAALACVVAGQVQREGPRDRGTDCMGGCRVHWFVVCVCGGGDCACWEGWYDSCAEVQATGSARSCLLKRKPQPHWTCGWGPLGCSLLRRRLPAAMGRRASHRTGAGWRVLSAALSREPRPRP